MGNSSATQKSQKQKKHPLGQLLIQAGLITKSQLQEALKQQVQVGSQLGSILVSMGFLKIGDLLTFLSKKFDVPAVNLCEINIPRNVLKLIPLQTIRAEKILPVAADAKTLTLAMVFPQDFVTISDIEFTMGKKIKPVVVPAFMMDAATMSLSPSFEDDFRGESIWHMLPGTRIEKSLKTEQLLRHMIRSKATDMLLTAGAPPSLKICNEVRRLTLPVLTPDDLENYARELMPDKEWNLFLDKHDLDLAITYPDIGRFRVNVYRQRNSISITLRYLPENLPSLKELNLPGWIKDFVLQSQGLILVCGPAGHGKTTTLAAMVDIINKNRRCNIVTLEDPVEYLHKHKHSNINQREIGRDADSFLSGLRSVFRQSPDVIVIDELRDKESIEIALHAANTGHLVLSTVLSKNSTAIIETILSMYTGYEQGRVRTMISGCLLFSCSQLLIDNKKRNGRVLALEKLVNSTHLKKLIREEKTYQIRTQMQGRAKEFTPIDIAIADLCNKGRIDYQEGLKYVENEDRYNRLTKDK
jgi:twitching motility protein PilT